MREDITKLTNEVSASIQNLNGKFDLVSANLTDKYTEDLSSTDGTLIIKDFRNCYIDISGDVDLSIINRGIEGQVIELVSSRGRKLKNISSNIVLLESEELTLHKYKGVKFVYINNKWTQIS